MTAIAIQAGFPQFADTDGTPLNSGKIYIGEVDKDPVANPLPVFFDEALTIPAAQPLDTTNGYLFYQGTPAAFYVGGSYSIKVLNKNEVTVYENPKGIVTNVTNNVENVTQYLGAASSPPIIRTDGTALQVGDIYFDTNTNLMQVYDGSSFIGFAGPYLPLVGGTMGGNIAMQDNLGVYFGASADLKIYHDGTDSYIKETGTGNLNIEGDANINIGSAFTGSPQIVVKGIGLNGSEFYFGASKKAEITTNGLDVTGTVNCTGATVAGDLVVEENTTGEALINVHNTATSGDADAVVRLDSSASGESVVEFYHDGTKVGAVDSFTDGEPDLNITTFGNANSVIDMQPNDTRVARFKNDLITLSVDTKIEYANNGDTAELLIHNTGTGDADAILKLDSSDAGESVVEFYHDGTKVAAVDSFTDGNPDLNITTFGAGSVVDVQPNNSLVARFSSTGLDVTGAVEFDSLSGTGSVSVTDILDEDNMVSDSATALATQQSIKAYVDAQVGASDALSEVLVNGNTTSGTDLVISSGDTLNASAATVTAGTVDINGGAIDGTTIGAAVPASATFTTSTSTTANITTGNITSANIDGGTIDGTVIGGSTIDGTVIGGTTAAAGTFTTLATGLTTIVETPASTDDSPLTVNRVTNDGALLSLQQGGIDQLKVYSTGGNRPIIVGEGDKGIKITPDSIQPRTSTNAVLNGVIDLGNSTSKFKDLYLSGGAYLGGTTAANKLDDYEEGDISGIELTDATNGASGGNLAAIGNLNAYYTKVGNMVHVIINLNNIDTTGMTGTQQLWMRGLPFPTLASSITTTRPYTVQVDTGGNTALGVVLSAVGNSNVAQFRLGFESGSTAALNVSAINNNTSDIQLNFSYKTAA